MTRNMRRPFMVGSLGLVLVLLAIMWNSWPLDEEKEVFPEALDPAPEVLETLPPVEEERHARFDVIRLSPEGLGVFAGEGPPGKEIVIVSNGGEIGRVVVDERGEWVWVATEPLPSGSHTLSLRVKEGERWLFSKTVAVVMVPEIEGNSDLKEGFALLVPGEEEGLTASTVLQRPNFQAGFGDTEESLGVDTIDYDDEGLVVISGRASPGSFLTVYLDDEKVGEVEMDLGDRLWSFRPEGRLAEGRYRLRVEQLLEGQVKNQIELPFHHAKFAGLAEDDDEGRKVVVQPGNSLWRIARKTLGEGTRYVIIYEANRLQIEDENLIYPGQVFTIPEEEGVGELGSGDLVEQGQE